MKCKKLRIILLGFLTVIFAVSAFHVAKITIDYKRADEANAALQAQFVQEIEPSTAPSADPADAPTTAPTTGEERPAVPIRVDFDGLMQKNSDIVGWLYCPDTPINYPVVKGKDNSQYLRTDLEGKYLVGGTLFADYRNGDFGKDANYIVYGHNMKNLTMFGTLAKYKSQSYYDAHPVLYFLTPEGNYIIELFAGAVVKRDSAIYQPAPKASTISDIIAKSTFRSTSALTEGDSIITLSTCSYEFNNARYVLLGRLIEI